MTDNITLIGFVATGPKHFITGEGAMIVIKVFRVSADIITVQHAMRTASPAALKYYVKPYGGASTWGIGKSVARGQRVWCGIAATS